MEEGSSKIRSPSPSAASDTDSRGFMLELPSALFRVEAPDADTMSQLHRNRALRFPREGSRTANELVCYVNPGTKNEVTAVQHDLEEGDVVGRDVSSTRLSRNSGSSKTQFASASGRVSTNKVQIESKLSDIPPILVSMYRTPLQRLFMVVLALAYLAGWWVFWVWWLFRVHPDLKPWPIPDILISIGMLWETFNGLYGHFLLIRAQRVNPALSSCPPQFRVAMVVTKAPSEPAEVVQKTLLGMLNQDYPYPYDCWLADEKPSTEMRLWCAKHNVQISTREGVEAYHQKTWPRRTKCKEGNLAYFYDMYGYDNYDIVAQFDADHVPSTSYLSSCIGAFLDPTVGYVGAPSICGANRKESWAVRGRLYQEGVFHGMYQASCNKTWFPVCIGSHYVVRTAHLKQAGGIGPELDEDYSTSYIMTANGFKGVFSIDTLADGDGPRTFEDCMTQEYQWARSMMILSVQYFPRWWSSKHLTVIERFRVVHNLMYWLASAVLPIGLVLLVVLPSVGISFGHFNFIDFVLHSLPTILVGYMVWTWFHFAGWLRPYYTPVISWEGIFHQFCKNFWISQGVYHGLVTGLLKRPFHIKVTPKGKEQDRMLLPQTLLPLLIMVAISTACVCFGKRSIHLSLLMGVAHWLVAVVITIAHYWENHSWKRIPWRNLTSLAGILLLMAAFGGFVVYYRADEIFHGYGVSFNTVYDNAGVSLRSFLY